MSCAQLVLRQEWCENTSSAALLASSMRTARLGMSHGHCLTLLLLLHPLISCATGQATDQRSHLRRLFEALDQDHDGQLHKQELRQYIGGLAPEYSNSRSKLDQAVEGAIDRLDSADIGLGVSRLELEQHLHTVLPGVKVADWVTHGLGLPQYAEVFRTNSITAVDLPMLVNDGGKLLQTELKVESPLHRQQLLRAMQRQIFGLGSPPGPAHALSCSASTSSTHQTTPNAAAPTLQATTAPSTAAAAAGGRVHTSEASADTAEAHGSSTAAGRAAGAASAAAAAAAGLAVVCSWTPPMDPGQPGMHKYVLQRLDHSVASATWQTVAELHDSLSVRYKDGPLSPGVYQYRLAAWNLYGRSPYLLSCDVTLPGTHAAAAAAATTAAADPAADPGVVLTGHLQAGHLQAKGLAAGVPGVGHIAGHRAEQRSSLTHSDTAHAGGMPAGLPYHQAGVCSGGTLPVEFVRYGLGTSQQQQQQQQQAGQAGACTADTSLDPANESQQGCPLEFGPQSELQGLGLVQAYSSIQNPGAGCHQSPSSSVLWLVGSDAAAQQAWQQHGPVTAAGREAQQSLAASMHAAHVANAGAAGGPPRHHTRLVAVHAHSNAALNAAAAAAAAAGDAAGPVSSSNSSHQPAVAAQLVAVLGSAWHSSLGGWVKAVLNTLAAFALVVLPVCVRLLPIPVLRRAAQLLATLLQLLPASLRRRLLLHPQQRPQEHLQEQQQQLDVSFRGSDLGFGLGAKHGGLSNSSSRGRLAASGASSSMLAAAGAAQQPLLVPAAAGFTAATPAAATGGSPVHIGPSHGGDEAKSGSMSLVTAAAALLGGLKSGRSSPAKVALTAGPLQQQQQLLTAELGVVPQAWQQQQCTQDSISAAGAERGLHGSAAEPLAAAATPGVRRRCMPRSVSDFDLARQTMPGSPVGRAWSALHAQTVTTPTSPSVLAAAAAAGAAAAQVLSPGAAGAGVRFASSGGHKPSDMGSSSSATAAAGSSQGFSQLVLGPSSSSSSWMPGAAAAPLEGVSPDGMCPGHMLSQHAGMDPSIAAMYGQVASVGAFQAVAEGLGVGGVQGEVERELQYVLYCTQGRTAPDNKQCCFPGCQQQFGLRHWKATLQRHYCGRCQQAFCMQHTAYSPHGHSGTCGVQSRCLCIDCFYEYTPEYQAFLASRNTLVGKRSKSSPPGGPPAGFVEGEGRQGRSSSSSSSRPGVLSRLVPSLTSSLSSSRLQESSSSRSLGRRQQQHSSGRDADADTEADGAAAAAAAEGGQQGREVQQDATGASELPQPEQQEQQHVRQGQLGAAAAAAQPAVAYSKGLKSRMLWERGLTKALGVVRFKHAGEGHAANQQARTASAQLPTPATQPAAATVAP